MIRILGAAFTIIGCGAVGFLLASNLTYEINCLQGLITVLEGWKNDISYHQSPLPELCRFVRCEESSVIYKFFSELNKELLSNSQPDAKCGISKVLSKFSDLPASCANLLLKLGNGLGKYDSLGQLNEIDSVLCDTKKTLESLKSKYPAQVKCYRMFGICTGITLAILII